MLCVQTTKAVKEAGTMNDIVLGYQQDADRAFKKYMHAKLQVMQCRHKIVMAYGDVDSLETNLKTHTKNETLIRNDYMLKAVQYKEAKRALG